MEKTRKIIAAAVFILLIAFMVFIGLRIGFAEYYPASVSRLSYTQTLTDYCTQNGGGHFETQDIRENLDQHRNKGAFFADKLILERTAGNLQITVKYNDSTLDMLGMNTEAGKGIFEYRIFAYTDADAKENIALTEYHAVLTEYDSVWFYNFEKVVFEGVDFTGVELIELRVYEVGSDEIINSIKIYENTEQYSRFVDYKLSGKEKLK